MNNLEDVPVELFGCGSLAWLALSGNPLVTRVTPPGIVVPEVDPGALLLTGTNIASAEYGGAANDGVITGTLSRVDGQPPWEVVVKYFADGIGPDGDPLDELRVTQALNDGMGAPGDGILTAAGIGTDASRIVTILGALSPRTLGEKNSGVISRRAAVYRLVEHGRGKFVRPLFWIILD